MASLRSQTAAKLLRSVASTSRPAVSPALQRRYGSDHAASKALTESGPATTATKTAAERAPNSPDWGVHIDKATSYVYSLSSKMRGTGVSQTIGYPSGKRQKALPICERKDGLGSNDVLTRSDQDIHPRPQARYGWQRGHRGPACCRALRRSHGAASPNSPVCYSTHSTPQLIAKQPCLFSQHLQTRQAGHSVR